MWLVCCYLLLTVYHVKFVHLRPPGLQRLALCLPVVLLTLIAPFNLQKATLRGSVAFVTSWLTSAKVLAAAAGKGPLANKQLTTAQQVALLLLPLSLARSGASFDHALAAKQYSSGCRGDETSRPVISAALNVVLAAAVILLLHTADWLPNWFSHMLYALVVWLTVAVLVDVPSALLAPHLGLHLMPAMNEPYKATGFAEFWGKRYNLVVSSTLRLSVYEPVLDLLQCPGHSHNASSQAAGRTRGANVAGTQPQQQQKKNCKGNCQRCQLARSLATVAVFAVSGLWHEICVWHMCQTSYITPGKPLLGRHMMFFLLQAPLVLLERHLLRSSSDQVPHGLHAIAAGTSKQQGGQCTSPRPVVNRCACARAAAATRADSTALNGCADTQYATSSGQCTRCGISLVQWQQVLRALGTYAVLFVLAEWLFWPPMESCKVDANGISEISDGLFWLRRQSLSSIKW